MFFLQVERRIVSDDNGQSLNRARFSHGIIKASKRLNFDDQINKLMIHYYRVKEAATADFLWAVLFEIVDALNKIAKGTQVEFKQC